MSQHPEPDIASFVLRFTQDAWEEPREGRRLRWRGHIRHVQGDAEAHFTDFADAVAFMQAELARLTLASVADAPERERAGLLQDSLQIWERFASDYADAVSGAVEQSERYQRQALDLFQKTLGAWAPKPSGGRPEASSSSETGRGAERADADVLDVIDQLRGQIDALARSVEALRPGPAPEAGEAEGDDAATGSATGS